MIKRNCRRRFEIATTTYMHMRKSCIYCGGSFA